MCVYVRASERERFLIPCLHQCTRTAFRFLGVSNGFVNQLAKRVLDNIEIVGNLCTEREKYINHVNGQIGFTLLKNFN